MKTLTLTIGFIWGKVLRNRSIFICLLLITAQILIVETGHGQIIEGRQNYSITDNLGEVQFQVESTTLQSETEFLAKVKVINSSNLINGSNCLLMLSNVDLNSIPSSNIPLVTDTIQVQQLQETGLADYEKSQGYVRKFSGSMKDLVIVEKGRSLPAIFSSLKWQALIILVKSLPKDQAAILSGLLFGETGLISQTWKQDWKDLGLSHLLAISGGNFALIVGCISILIKKLPHLLRLGIQLGIAFGYLLLIGITNYAAFRAFNFLLLNITQKILGRKISTGQVILWSVAIILFVEPLAYKSLSLQLSLLAVVILQLTKRSLPIIEKLLKRFDNQSWIIEEMGSSFIGTVLLLPINLMIFQQANLISTLANIFTVPLVAIFSIIGLLETLLLGMYSNLKVLFNPLNSNFMESICFITNQLSQIKFLTIINSQLEGKLVIFAGLGVYLQAVKNLIIRLQSNEKYYQYY